MLKQEKRPGPILLFNFVSKTLDISGSLDYDKMLKKAFRNTGLNDLGKDFNVESLQVLVKSINQEANLHPFGNLMIREKLIGQLENRLWAEYWFNKYPEILDLEVLPIIMITGLQRSGTTKMQRLLSDQPGARALMSWEALYPAPIKDSNETAKRIARTNKNERAVKYISPTFQSIHPIHTDRPEEDVLLLDVHFMSSSSEAILNVPSYANWLEQQDHTEAYLYEKKLLQLLQWQKGGEFWVLKSPHHLQYLNEFNKVFPDSRTVWMHRNIEDCIPSFLSMLYYSRSMFVENVDKKALKSHWLKKLSLMLEGGLNYRNTNSNKIIDVAFDQFIEDENKVIASIMNTLSPNSTLKKQEIQVDSGLEYKSRHRYNLDDWGINLNDLRVTFEDYVKVVNIQMKSQT